MFTSSIQPGRWVNLEFLICGKRSGNPRVRTADAIERTSYPNPESKRLFFWSTNGIQQVKDKPEIPASSPVQPILMDAKQTAVALGISERKLWTLTNCGEVPSIRLGKLLRYSPDVLRDWVKRRHEEKFTGN